MAEQHAPTAGPDLFQLQQAVNASGEVIFMTDRQGIITFVNREFVRLYGYTVEEVVGRTTPRILRSGCTSPERYSALWQQLLQGEVVRGQLINRTKHGELVHIEFSANPVCNGQNEIVGFLGVQRDITERRRLAVLLERQNSLLNAVIATSPIGIAVLEGRAFVCNTVNPAFQRLVPGADAGLVLREVWPGDPADIMPMFERILAAAASAECVDVELPASSATGKGRARSSVTVTASLLLLPGCTIPNLLVLLTDTTSCKQLEAQFYQAQKMEAVGRLAGGIAHDFNNLLTSILGYADLLWDEMGTENRLRADVEEIRRAGLSAVALTRQLLTFSRKQIVEPTILDVNAVVGQFDKIVRRTIGEDITLNMRLEPTVDRIKMDPGQLEQILMNLSVNARDAMPHGGTLTIETANIAVQEHEHPLSRQIPSGRYVVLTVTDTGMGMSREVQSHIFEPFFTTKEFGKGTGLGLSTVFGIVKQHEGYIGVSSQLNHGTSFTVYFPRVERQKPVVTEQTLSEPRPRGHETILIVEDDPGLRALISKTLDNCGYFTLAARDAGEAMELSARFAGPIHLLLTDVVMPGTDGAELARQLTALRAETRVLYMSGHADGVLSDRGVLNKGMRFLPKPFAGQTLARKVREALGPFSPLLPTRSPNRHSSVGIGPAASPNVAAVNRL